MNKAAWDIKHPEVVVTLSGQDGNPYMIIGLTRDALKKAKVPQAEIQEYMDEAKSGDYDNVIQTTLKWVTVE